MTQAAQPGSLSFTLTRAEKFDCLFMPKALRLFLLDLALAVTLVAGLAWLYLSGRADESFFILGGLAAALCGSAPVLGGMLRAWIRAGSILELPGGETNLEWDQHFLRVRTQTNNLVFAWREVKLLAPKNGALIFTFPDGRSTGIFPNYASEAIRTAVLACACAPCEESARL